MKNRIGRVFAALSLAMVILAQTVVSPNIVAASHGHVTPISVSLSQMPSDYIEHLPIYVQESSDFISFGFDGTGTPDDPFAIEGLNITATTRCVYLQNISDHVVIRNCYFRASNYQFPCVALDHTNQTTFEKCIFQGGSCGMSLANTAFISAADNIFLEAEIGIRATSAFMFNCSRCRILNNEYGILLSESHVCNLTRNKVYRNSEFGICMGLESVNNLVTENTVGRNHASEIEINAIDIGLSNNWTGNYWSDYAPPGPYTISGAASSTDNTPSKFQDDQSPFLEAHQDLFYAEGSTGNEIQWNATDEFSWTYVITRGTQVEKEGTWISQIITFEIDGLPQGNHMFQIRLFDIDGNEAFDDVEVFVFVIIFSNIGTTELMIGSLGSVGFVLGVLIFFKMRQKRHSSI